MTNKHEKRKLGEVLFNFRNDFSQTLTSRWLAPPEDKEVAVTTE
jgi:hypothetical protein